MLAIAVNAYGSGNWTRIHKHIPGRTDVQCRERWVNVLNPELNAGPWTPEVIHSNHFLFSNISLGRRKTETSSC